MKVSFRRFAYDVFFRFSPLLIVILLELSLRFFGAGQSYLLFNTSDDGTYYELNPLYYRRFVAPEQFEDVAILPQRFPVEKPETSKRIFLIGDQTLCSAFPDANQLQIVSDFYDNDSIYYDIIQLAVPYGNSFALKRLVRSLNRYEGDAVIVISGASEFYGLPRKSNWMQDIDYYWGLTAYITLKNHRFIQALERFVYLKKDPHTTFPPDDIDEWVVPYQSVEYIETTSNFSRNIRRMIKNAACPLHFVSLPINIKARPYRSLFDDKELLDAEIARECAILVNNSDRFTIERWIIELQAWEPETAIYYYCKGLITEKEGDAEAALQYYTTALDRDVFRVRSDSNFSRIIDNQIVNGSAGHLDLNHHFYTMHNSALTIQRYFSNALALNPRGREIVIKEIKNLILEPKNKTQVQ